MTARGLSVHSQVEKSSGVSMTLPSGMAPARRLICKQSSRAWKLRVARIHDGVYSDHLGTTRTFKCSVQDACFLEKQILGNLLLSVLWRHLIASGYFFCFVQRNCLWCKQRNKVDYGMIAISIIYISLLFYLQFVDLDNVYLIRYG